jgi:hypothetical protein
VTRRGLPAVAPQLEAHDPKEAEPRGAASPVHRERMTVLLIASNGGFGSRGVHRGSRRRGRPGVSRGAAMTTGPTAATMPPTPRPTPQSPLPTAGKTVRGEKGVAQLLAQFAQLTVARIRTRYNAGTGDKTDGGHGSDHPRPKRPRAPQSHVRRRIRTARGELIISVGPG